MPNVAHSRIADAAPRKRVVSEDLPLTMVTAVGTTVIMSLLHLDRAPTLVGVAAAPFIADVLKNVLLRHDRPNQRLGGVTPLASFLSRIWRRAATAIQKAVPLPRRVAGASAKPPLDRSRLGWTWLTSTALVTAVVAAGATIAVFTVPELAIGRAIFAPDRSTTFFSDTPTLVLDVPSALKAEAVGRRGAPVRYEADARSPDGLPVTLRCRPPSGAVFPIGPTLVRCRASARAEGSPPVVVHKTFVVTVVDTTAPTITLPNELAAEATSAAGATVNYEVSATDTVDTAPAVNCSRRSGFTFPIGTTTLECTAADDFDNRATKSLTITVADTMPPRLDVPGDGVITEDAVSREGARVDYALSASDVVDTQPAIECDRDSGSTFPIGTTTVECRARDRAGNESTRTLTIDIIDRPPIIKAPRRIVRPYTSANGTRVFVRIFARDKVDGKLTPQCTPPLDQPFFVGVTHVTCRVTDSSGKAATRSFPVVIIDRVDPRITAPASFSVWAPYTAQYYRVIFRVSAYDEIDKSVPVVCTPSSGSEFVVGRTTMVTCSATDRSENTATAQFSITVRRAPE